VPVVSGTLLEANTPLKLRPVEEEEGAALLEMEEEKTGKGMEEEEETGEEEEEEEEEEDLMPKYTATAMMPAVIRTNAVVQPIRSHRTRLTCLFLVRAPTTEVALNGCTWEDMTTVVNGSFNVSRITIAYTIASVCLPCHPRLVRPPPQPLPAHRFQRAATIGTARINSEVGTHELSSARNA
jgi:hypothetical protein